MRNRDTKTNGTGFAPNVNLISQGTSILGEITSQSDIRIDGQVEGTIRSESKVVVGASGKVNGDIICASADILGHVNGTITCKDILFLKSTAHIDGDITTNKLVVESGAVFNGNCKMGEVKDHKVPVHGKEAAAASKATASVQ
jgi:cytoskeletal protein CcmA (bactofilin family)